MSKTLKSLLITSVAFALGAPAMASAAPQSDLKGAAVKVTYADLNLDKAEGAKVLYRRLQQAAKQACGMSSLRDDRAFGSYAEARDCYRTTLDASVAKVDNARVSSIHEG